MAGVGDDDWVYVLSQQDAEAEQAVIADVGEKSNDKPSKNPESKGGGAVDEEYRDWYTPEEVQVEKAHDAYTAALDRCSALGPKVDDDEFETEIDRAYEAFLAALDHGAAAMIDGTLEIDNAPRVVASTTTEPSKNPNADDDKAASAQPPESDKKAAAPLSYPDPDYTPEELEVEKASEAYMAAYRRANEMQNELETQSASRDAAFRAYMAAADSNNSEESEIETAFGNYMAAFRRAAAMADAVEIEQASRDRACRAYVAALERASATKLDDGDTDSAASAGQGPRVMENPCYDLYNDTYGGAEPGPYYRDPHGGTADSASLGLGSGYDYGYANRYGYGFPGAYYGAATGFGYGYGYDGCYLGEPYAYPYVLGYTTAAAAAYQEPLPALSANLLSYPLPAPERHSSLAPPPAPVSIRRSGSHTGYSARADELAPTTTQPPEPSQHY